MKSTAELLEDIVFKPLEKSLKSLELTEVTQNFISCYLNYMVSGLHSIKYSQLSTKEIEELQAIFNRQYQSYKTIIDKDSNYSVKLFKQYLCELFTRSTIQIIQERVLLDYPIQIGEFRKTLVSICTTDFQRIMHNIKEPGVKIAPDMFGRIKFTPPEEKKALLNEDIEIAVGKETDDSESKEPIADIENQLPEVQIRKSTSFFTLIEAQPVTCSEKPNNSYCILQ